jgi:hypothetical protein
MAEERAAHGPNLVLAAQLSDALCVAYHVDGNQSCENGPLAHVKPPDNDGLTWGHRPKHHEFNGLMS